jgi:hypothetical protein
MQLKLLHQQFESYRRFLQSSRAGQRLYAWESQRIFQENWDLDAPDLAAMYDGSLENSTTRRLWKRESYEPKRLMLAFLRMEPEFVRSMFQELFDETKRIELRAGRFVFYCDELLQSYKKANPLSIENNHYHGDYQMIFLYLAFRYPERYAMYDFPNFVHTLEVLGVANLPPTHDLERYVKVTHTLYKLLQKEETLMQLHRTRLDPKVHYMGPSCLLVYDFFAFCGQ